MENGWIGRQEDEDAKSKIVGNCAACDEEIWDYAEVICDCGASIHNYCLQKCMNCEEYGCKKCMVDDGNDNYYCDEDCKNEGDENGH